VATKTALSQNLRFSHWYPELLLQGLTPEQLSWQPADHDTSIIFAVWHAYRAEDDLVHGMVMRQPSVFVAQKWAERLPVKETGITPFGNGLTREQIGRIRLDATAIIEYAKAVGESVAAYLASMSDEDGAAEISLPFFKDIYPASTCCHALRLSPSSRSATRGAPGRGAVIRVFGMKARRYDAARRRDD
jgi:hypothetical protein